MFHIIKFSDHSEADLCYCEIILMENFRHSLKVKFFMSPSVSENEQRFREFKPMNLGTGKYILEDMWCQSPFVYLTLFLL